MGMKLKTFENWGHLFLCAAERVNGLTASATGIIDC